MARPGSATKPTPASEPLPQPVDHPARPAPAPVALPGAGGEARGANLLSMRAISALIL